MTPALDDDHGAPNVAIRRFVLEPGAEVPKHTNDIEHEQSVLTGECVVGISDAPEAHRVDDDSAERSRGNSASSRPLEDEIFQDSADRSSGRRPREEAVDGDEEHVVEPSDSLLIPAGTGHWYRNEGDESARSSVRFPTATTKSSRSSNGGRGMGDRHARWYCLGVSTPTPSSLVAISSLNRNYYTLFRAT